MKDFQKRVVEERKELREKMVKLATFLYTPASDSIEAVERDNLLSQFQIVQDYDYILGERIARFE